MKNLKELPRTKKAALSIGIPYYFTGKKCKLGHISEKCAHTSVGCVACTKEERTEHMAATDYAPTGAQALISGVYYKFGKLGRVLRHGINGWVSTTKHRNEILFDVGFNQPKYWSYCSE